MNSSTSLSQTKKVCWYDKYSGLQGSMLSKAKKFNRLGLVKQLGKSYNWIVKPIEGYNVTEYQVMQDQGRMKCNCQYNTTKDKICSHILAVELSREISTGDLMSDGTQGEYKGV